MKKLILSILLATTAMVSAQKVTVLSGDFQNLKGIADYNLTFDYAGLTVDRLSEDQFLIDKMKKREGNGKDLAFKQSWFADRDNRYEPKFVQSFNCRFKKGTMKADENHTAAKYNMHIQTTWIHPGFNVGIMHNSALVNMVVTFVEIANPANVLLSVKYERVSGKGIFTPIGFMDYNAGYRISESYAKLAKTLASNMRRRIK